MKTKTINRLNGGFAFYYGFFFILVAIGGIIGLGIFLYDYFFGDNPFIWWQFGLILSFVLIPGLISYVLMRVGYEQAEE